jgi:hypothetical protein
MAYTSIFVIPLRWCCLEIAMSPQPTWLPRLPGNVAALRLVPFISLRFRFRFVCFAMLHGAHHRGIQQHALDGDRLQRENSNGI